MLKLAQRMSRAKPSAIMLVAEKAKKGYFGKDNDF